MNKFYAMVSRSVVYVIVYGLMLLAVTPVSAVNPIAAENALTGNLASEWDVSGAGDPSIQGFATDISVNKGEMVRFKVDTDARAYRIDIYRLGYYKGRGARKVTTITPSVALPQRQPEPLSDPATGLVDCGNWAQSASWRVPLNATSGVYIGRLVRTDTGGASHMVFVVRDDAGRADILFQTSDTTWQAYNTYGGNSLYVGSPAGRAYKVSYNRPFVTRAGVTAEDWLFSAEYPMIRWLEANGYHVSYFTGVDTDRRGAQLKNHKVFLSVGHDEYWSAQQRANVEAARDAGVHLAFFSGNEVFWKTRWEPAIDGSETPYRTLVCYKETHAGAKIDPSPVWTGTWRDPRFSPPSDGGQPENALTGTLFTVNGPRNDSITVPASYGAHRFWRHTSVATLGAGQVATFPPGTLGYEWDEALENGVQPPGLMRLSSTTVDRVSLLQDHGSKYASGQATHNLTLYRHQSGALVFGAGTVQWSWGLDSFHDNSSTAEDTRMRQATVNLFADMGAFPETVQSGLVVSTASNDTAAPVSIIQTPSAGATIDAGTTIDITGIATDSRGRVWGVEVSVDGGVTWRSASGRESWSYTWTPVAGGSVTIKSRAFDDSGNIEAPSSGSTVTVNAPKGVSIWPVSAIPKIVDVGPDQPVELGVKFRSDTAGTITGMRFYKATANTGTHVGSLWTSAGTRLAFATFRGESASGWQHVNFSTPVSISANTVYIASYHCPGGHYSKNENYFATSGVNSPPLFALANGVSESNGVYRYGPAGTFPNQTWRSANYWVDVVFEPAPAGALTSIAVTPSGVAVVAGNTQQFKATGTYANGSTQDLTGAVTWRSSNTGVATIGAGGLATAVGAGTATITATSGSVSSGASLTVQSASLAITTTALPGGTLGAAYSTALTADGGTLPHTWSLASGSLPPGLALSAGSGEISGIPTTTGTFGFTVQVSDASSPAQSATKSLSIAVTAAPPLASLWTASTVPAVVDKGRDKAVELGVKFRSDVAGSIIGIRFYKAPLNTGTHVGSLWSSTGAKLASAAFPEETASGWQQVTFSTPVPISANTTYIASYHCPIGHYSVNEYYFTTNGWDNPPLRALASGIQGGNGVYIYGPAGSFPSKTWNAANYWVDVVFQPN